MLSRTADHLHWMARYLERAETVARALEAEQQLALLPRSSEAAGRSRRATLVALGAHDIYDRLAPATGADVLEFLSFSRDYAGSIVSCISQARENARAVRGAVASETWETINATWLEVRALERRKGADRARLLYELVRLRAHMIRGVTAVAMLRDEAFHFMRIGTFLERADGTARLLDARHASSVASEHAGDTAEWTVLLRTLSAFEAYRRLFREVVTARRVAEMFILRHDVPRSLRRCLMEVRDNLGAVRNDTSAETERRVGALQARLEFAQAADIAPEKLSDYLTDMVEQLALITAGIAHDFLVPVAPPHAAPAEPAQQ